MFEMFNILFIVQYYLCVMFNFLFIENNYLFGLLKYWFPVTEINYLVLKILFKISCKHRQVWSCSKDFIIRKIMVQPKLIWMLGLIVIAFVVLNLQVCG
jgi:hypothetical protein